MASSMKVHSQSYIRNLFLHHNILKLDSKKRRDSDSDRSSSSLLSSDDSKDRSETTNAAYELYKRMKKERKEPNSGG